jgi:hypothetical protein
MQLRLGEIAYARSGDKGSGASLGVIAHTQQGYEHLREILTASAMQTYFKPMGCATVKRYEVPNLLALHFILPEILAGGGSRSLRIDAQGKAIGQVALEMTIEIPEDLIHKCTRGSA